MPEISILLLFSTFIAGFLMFLAPCTLPLVPPFLAYISGQKETSKEINFRKIILNTLAFCFGFSVVFILLGVTVGYVSSLFSSVHLIITKLSALLIIFLGLALFGFFELGVTKGFPLPKNIQPGSTFGSAIIGILFATGWSPCVGPIMATILLLTAGEGTTLSGLILLTVFSLGLSLPFLITALFFEKLKDKFRKYAQFSRLALKLSAVFLITIGVLMLFGQEGLIIDFGTRLFFFLKLEFLFDYY